MARTLFAAIVSAAVGVTTFLPPAYAQRQPDAPPPAAAQPDAPTDAAQVPVRAVVLFSSGVGYFEHFGSVQGNGTTELRFKTEQVNDVLKSLVLQDLGGGAAGTVSYPSQEPLARTLKSFQVDVTANPSLGELLNQLRGAKLTLTLAEGAAVGTILGVEKKLRAVNAGGKEQVIETGVLNLKVGRKVRAVALDDVRDFQLDDERLDRELDQALSALAASRDQDKKPVTINFRGEGERQVRLGYVVETPIWKSSYRLILDGPAAGRGEVEPADAERAEAEQTEAAPEGGAVAARPPGAGESGGKLQGWAIVENQTDNDWNDVQLSLVSGRPISFIQDLYHPLYVPRPIVWPELYASLRPQTYEGGVTLEEMEKIKKLRAEAGDMTDAPDFALESTRDKSRGRGGQGGGGGLFANSSAGEEDEESEDPPAMDPAASVRSMASAGKVGELFQYTVGNVSVPRQKSAMIPIVTEDVEVEKVSIYNANVLEDHPLNGARLKNTTKNHLLQGPVTVLEGGAYAGDARIEDLPPGQERLLSYGVDLEMRVTVEGKSHDAIIQTGRVVKGVLEVRRKQVNEQEYVAQNKSDRVKTLIIETPRYGDSELIEPATAEETTDALYRFRREIKPGAAGTLTYRRETYVEDRLNLLPAVASDLELFVKAAEIPAEVREALARAIRLKAAAAATARGVAESKQRIADVAAEQTRIRENMKAVAQNTEYYSRLVKKLDEQETAIEGVQAEIAKLQERAETQRKELEDYVAGLTVG